MSYEPEESEISKLFTLAFLMLAICLVQIGLFKLGIWLLGTLGAILACAAIVAFWMWLFRNEGIDYYPDEPRTPQETKEV